jgi:eukaryotic translation initiation factor 2C
MLPFIIVVYIFSIHDLFILSQEFSQEPVIPVYSARPDMVKKALKYVHSTSINKLDGKELELLIAILPDNNGSLYGMILRYSSTLYYFIF